MKKNINLTFVSFNKKISNDNFYHYLILKSLKIDKSYILKIFILLFFIFFDK